MSSGLTPGGRINSAFLRADRGFTILEALMVVAIVVIMAAMAIPLMQSTLAYFDLQSSTNAVSGAIQSTRFRSVSDGLPYRVTFSKSAKTYQVANCSTWTPGNSCTGCLFSNLGGPVSFGGSQTTLGADAALTFCPSGIVSFTTGSNPITITRKMGASSSKSKSLTVSNYGSVSIQ